MGSGARLVSFESVRIGYVVLLVTFQWYRECQPETCRFYRFWSLHWCTIRFDREDIFRQGLATQFSVGGDLGQIGDAGVTVDLIQHLPSLNDPLDGYSVPIYIGGGVTASSKVEPSGTNTFIGLRGVFGLLMTADGLPVEIYIETNSIDICIAANFHFLGGWMDNWDFDTIFNQELNLRIKTRNPL